MRGKELPNLTEAGGPQHTQCNLPSCRLSASVSDPPVNWAEVVMWTGFFFIFQFESHVHSATDQGAVGLGAKGTQV